MVTRLDIINTLKELGVKNGDILLVHSSFKSLGKVEDGAETVIQGFMDAIGKEGTLVFPTFCQKEFEKAYETWHIDKHSDTGYLTNYFRKREGSIRSDQATHSVAASGKFAEELTKTHGHTHKRWGNMGDTPFSADSPWEKMYNMKAKVVLLGVGEGSITFRHYAEYIFINECLDSIKDCSHYQNMKERLWHYNKPGVWPHVLNEEIRLRLENNGLWKTAECKGTRIMAFTAKDFVDTTLEALRKFDESVLWRTELWNTDEWIKWTKDLRRMQGEV